MTAAATGFYLQTKSLKDGIHRCECNFAFIPFCKPHHASHDSETLEDGSVIIVRSHSFLILRFLQTNSETLL